MDKPRFSVLIDDRVEKDLKRIPKYIVDRFLDSLDGLEEDPIHARSGMDIKRLKGNEIFRLRLGDYRVLYSIEIATNTVKVTSIYHRGKAYRMFSSFISP